MQLTTKRQEDGLSNNVLFVIVLFIGIIMGTLIMSMVGYGLWALNYVCIYDVDCPSLQSLQNTNSAQSADAGENESVFPEETPSPLPTLDLEATATVACGNFAAQFPGTPCPDS
jgi:hypothetical protein